jgi:hypothetical protein
MRKGRRRSSGHRTATGKWLPFALLAAAAGLLLAGGLALYRAAPFTPSRRGQEVVTASQRLVRASIPNGRKAAFCPPEQAVVESFADGKFRVSGWVDLIGPDGKAERRVFSVVVHRSAGNQWVGEAVSLVPQVL